MSVNLALRKPRQPKLYSETLLKKTNQTKAKNPIMYHFHLLDSQIKEVLLVVLKRMSLSGFLTLLWKYKVLKLDAVEILKIIKVTAGN